METHIPKDFTLIFGSCRNLHIRLKNVIYLERNVDKCVEVMNTNLATMFSFCKNV